MNHICFIDPKSKEYAGLITNQKLAVINCSNRKKIPYEKVFVNDVIYFANKKCRNHIIGKGRVVKVINIANTRDKKKELTANLCMFVEAKKISRKKFITYIEIEAYNKVRGRNLTKGKLKWFHDWILNGILEVEE